MTLHERPTPQTGRNLFEAGCTILAAERFRDMPTNDGELIDYFDWERDCLIAYAHSLSLSKGECVVCQEESRVVRSRYTTCNGTVAHLPDGRFKCINCGAVNGKFAERV